MTTAGVVVVQSGGRTESLAWSLRHYFEAIHVAHSADDLREIILQHYPQVAIVDMEIVSLSELQRLKGNFGGIYVVCTHRLADEALWIKALDAGAADVCMSDDTRSIVAAAIRYAPIAHSAAA